MSTPQEKQYEEQRVTLQQLVAKENPSNFGRIGQAIQQAAKQGQLPTHWEQIGHAFAQSEKAFDDNDRQGMQDSLSTQHVVGILQAYDAQYQVSKQSGAGPARSLWQSVQHGMNQLEQQTTSGSSR